MRHNHHACKCSHLNVKFCSHCNTVYCLNCNQEWTPKATFSYTNWGQTSPWYTYLGSNQVGGAGGGTTYDTGGIRSANLSTVESQALCKHDHKG